MRVAAFYAPNDGLFKYHIVPKASLQRASGQRLNSSQSVRLTRLASVWALAHRTWKTDQATRDFLFRPHSLLENQRPVDVVLKDELGAQQVRSVLGQLDAGSAV
jgi:putative toxin-antitoxin system antitoxin component (TIGR02293 family)